MQKILILLCLCIICLNIVTKWLNNNKTIASKSLEYKTKLVGRTPNNNDILDGEVVVPLKYFINF